MTRFKTLLVAQRPLLRLVGGAFMAVAVVALLLGAYQAYLQYQEGQQLQKIAASLHTGNPATDIEAVVNYVYDHAYIGDGKYGLLRASATQVMDPAIGGQCGEFVRLTVNLLSEMGYSAHRLYLFPEVEAGQTFDPVSQPSFHVAAEVWVNDRWVLIDPLHGLVFKDETGNLATLPQVVSDRAIIKAGYVERPLEIHPATYGGIATAPYYIKGTTFANPQGINWGQRPFLWVYKAVERVGPTDLSKIYLPVIVEQPYAMQMLFWWVVGAVCGLLSVACFVAIARADRTLAADATALETASQNLQTA